MKSALEADLRYFEIFVHEQFTGVADADFIDKISEGFICFTFKIFTK